MFEQLKPIPPFDFEQMLRRPLSRLSSVNVIDPSEPSFTRAIRCRTRPIPVTIAGAGTVEQPLLRVTIPDDSTPDEQMQIMDIARHMFSVEVDLLDFYRTVDSDEHFTALIQNHYGLRPIQDASLFESIIKVIIGQQLNVQFAATLVERLINHGGEKIIWNDMELSVFPSPERLASWSYDELREYSFSQRKAEYVIDLARAMVDGKIDVDALWALSDDEVYERLTPLRGVGRWTVECFLLFGMGRTDVMPTADIGVLNAVKKVYAMEKRPTSDEMGVIAERFVPWRSYAAYYLWQSLIP